MATTKQADASRYNQKMVRGDRFYRAYAFRNDQGEPIDISGFTFQGQIRETFANTTAIDFTITTALSEAGLAIGVSKDTMIINLDAPLTQNVQDGAYVYDIQKTMIGDPDFVETFLRGYFYILPEVTR